jgi:hypothetical protein
VRWLLATVFKRTYGTKDGSKDDDGGRCGISAVSSLINQPFPSRNERHGSKPCGGHHFLSILWFGFAFWRSQGLGLCGSPYLITFFFVPEAAPSTADSSEIWWQVRQSLATSPPFAVSRQQAVTEGTTRGPWIVGYATGSIDKALFRPLWKDWKVSIAVSVLA